MFVWTTWVPLLSIALVGLGIVMPMGTPLAAVCAALALIGAVIAAVHHAEVVAHRVGEPFGTLVLAVAVTVIEVALIVSMMLAGGADQAALPRDTIFAAVMIICNGVVGLCLLVGGLRHHEQSFRVEGANAGLAALIALATLSLVLPRSRPARPGRPTRGRNSPSPRSRRSRFGASSCSCRPCGTATTSCRPGRGDEDVHAQPPSSRRRLGELRPAGGLAGRRGGSRQAVVADHRARGRRGRGAARSSASRSQLLVLLPETGGVSRRARRPHPDQPEPRARFGACEHRPDDSRRRARRPCWLPLARARAEGHGAAGATFVVTALTLVPGRTTVMQGAIHLVLFAAFLFLALVP